MARWLTFGFLSVLVGCSFDPEIVEWDGCKKDSDCRSGRTCVLGTCSDSRPDLGLDSSDSSLEGCTDKDEDGFYSGLVCNARWLDCDDDNQNIHPGAPQICNGLDNDCDGEPDLDACECSAGESEACGSDVGACMSGVRNCVEGLWGPCKGGTEPKEETCDGVDNDCDGVMDEGCACQGNRVRECGLGIGECIKGEQTCESGMWGACEGAVTPSPEVCDGLDNDCDDEVDDNPDLVGTPCGTGNEVGVCADPVLTCTNGRLFCGSEIRLSETCNELDDDCDGEVDEGLYAACTSACGPGFESCIAGVTSACVPTSPPPEVCDGVDNNCDGNIDESFPEAGQACTTGLAGDCSSGVLDCAGGGLVCVPDLANQPEICDGSDNDCDGIIDEDLQGMALARQCGTACPDRSVQLCSAGVWGSCDRVDMEVCNGEDSNCDGSADEQAVCYQVCNNVLVEGLLSCATPVCELPATFCTSNPTCCP